jgi:hypothetical protein
MSTTNERPIDFCLHLAAGVRQGKKTITYKPLPAASAARYLATKTLPPPMYGLVGDLLWMREPFAIEADSSIDYLAARAGTKYDTRAATAGQAMHASTMTRDQAAIVLKLTEITVVRLSDDLTEEKARAAGMDPRDKRSYRAEFAAQWDEAYKGLAVATNPVVWRLSFAVVAPKKK